MNARQSTILTKILSENTDRTTRRALVLEYARLEAQPIPAGTRVRTPYGHGTVEYSGAIPVRFDAATQQPATVGLVPADKVEVIEGRRGAAPKTGTAMREGGSC